MRNSSKGQDPNFSYDSILSTPTPSARRTIGPRAPKSKTTYHKPPSSIESVSTLIQPNKSQSVTSPYVKQFTFSSKEYNSHNKHALQNSQLPLPKTPEKSTVHRPKANKVEVTDLPSSSSVEHLHTSKHLKGPRLPKNIIKNSEDVQIAPVTPPVHSRSSDPLPKPPVPSVPVSKTKRRTKHKLAPVVEVPEITNEVSPKFTSTNDEQVYRLRSIRAGSPNSVCSFQFEIPSTRPPSLDQLIHLFNDFLRHPVFDFDENAIEMLQSCTPDEKWCFIRSNFAGFDDPSFQIPELAAVHRPVSWFVIQLWNKTISNLQLITLSSLLSTQSDRWISLFLELQGLRALHNLLTYFNSSAVVQPQQAEVPRCMLTLLKKKPTLVTSNSYIFQAITVTLISPNLLPRKVAADLLTWVLSLKEPLVVSILESGFKEINAEYEKEVPLFFGWIKSFKDIILEKELARTPPSSPARNSASSSPSNIAFLEYCTSTMEFINQLIVACEELEQGFDLDILDSLRESGIHEVIQLLRNFPDQQLEKQLNIYESEEERRTISQTTHEDADSFMSNESSILSSFNEFASNEVGRLLESTIQNILLAKGTEKQKVKLIKVFNSLLQRILLNSKVSNESFEDSLQASLNMLTERFYSDDTARNALKEAKASRAMAEKMVIERDAMAAQVNLGAEDLIAKLNKEVEDQKDVILSQKRTNETLKTEIDALQKSHVTQIQRSEVELRELYLLINSDSFQGSTNSKERIIEYLLDKLDLRKKEIAAESTLWSNDGIDDKLRDLREQMSRQSSQPSTVSTILQIPDKKFHRPFPRHLHRYVGRSASESLTSENDESIKSMKGIDDFANLEIPGKGIESNVVIKDISNQTHEINSVENKAETVSNNSKITNFDIPNDATSLPTIITLPTPPPPPPLPVKTSLNTFSHPDSVNIVANDTSVAGVMPAFPPPPPPPPPLVSAAGGKFVSPAVSNNISKDDLHKTTGLTRRPTRRLKQMHWEKLNSGLEFTFWTGPSDEANKILETLHTSGVLDELDESFAMKEAKTLVKKTCARTDYMSSELQKLFGIHFHKLSHKNPNEIIRMILHCDDSMNECVEFLSSDKVLNQPKLKADLEPYRIDWANGGDLVNSEKDASELSRWDYLYVRLIVDLGGYWNQRMNALKVKNIIETNYENLVRQTKLIGRAALELRDSKVFKGLLYLILYLGNYMNDYVRQAKGFAIGSLQRLPLIKNANNTKSLLHILDITIRKHFPQFDNFSPELSTVTEAAKLNIEAIEQECSELIRGCQNLQIDCDSGALSDPTVFHPDDKILSVILPWLMEGTKKMDFLKEHLRTMNTTLNNAMRYFGEQPNDPNSKNLFFKRVDSFIIDYSKARSDNLKSEEEEASQHRRLNLVNNHKEHVLERAMSENNKMDNEAMDGFLDKLRNVKLESHHKPRNRSAITMGKEHLIEAPNTSTKSSPAKNELFVPKRSSVKSDLAKVRPRYPKGSESTDGLSDALNITPTKKGEVSSKAKKGYNYEKRRSGRQVSDSYVLNKNSKNKSNKGRSASYTFSDPSSLEDSNRQKPFNGEKFRRFSSKSRRGSQNRDSKKTGEARKNKGINNNQTSPQNKPSKESLKSDTISNEKKVFSQKASKVNLLTPTISNGTRASKHANEKENTFPRGVENNLVAPMIPNNTELNEDTSAVSRNLENATNDLKETFPTTTTISTARAKPGNNDINTILRRNNSRGRRRMLQQMSPLKSNKFSGTNDLNFQQATKPDGSNKSSYMERLEKLKQNSERHLQSVGGKKVYSSEETPVNKILVSPSVSILDHNRILSQSTPIKSPQRAQEMLAGLLSGKLAPKENEK